MTTKDLTGKEYDEAVRAFNTNPRNAVLEAEMVKAEIEYARTGNKKVFDLACKAAFAKYDAAAH